jgi:hypothetical protein
LWLHLLTKWFGNTVRVWGRAKIEDQKKRIPLRVAKIHGKASSPGRKQSIPKKIDTQKV